MTQRSKKGILLPIEGFKRISWRCRDGTETGGTQNSWAAAVGLGSAGTCDQGSMVGTAAAMPVGFSHLGARCALKAVGLVGLMARWVVLFPVGRPIYLFQLSNYFPNIQRFKL
jgi:hypothetical protein